MYTILPICQTSYSSFIFHLLFILCIVNGIYCYNKKKNGHLSIVYTNIIDFRTYFGVIKKYL